MRMAADAWGHSPRKLGAHPPEGQGESRRSRCRECLAGLEHCHGTVIHHTKYRSECTEPDCVCPEAAHAFAVDCAAMGCSCGNVAAMAS